MWLEGSELVTVGGEEVEEILESKSCRASWAAAWTLAWL